MKFNAGAKNINLTIKSVNVVRDLNIIWNSFVLIYFIRLCEIF